jgi:hypothetical protein
MALIDGSYRYQYTEATDGFTVSRLVSLHAQECAVPSLDLPTFVARWQQATLTERSAAQSHFNDLCHCPLANLTGGHILRA